jgi:hypothetical protein
VGVTSVLILLLLGLALYFMAVVLRFKTRVLAFFAEIDRRAMVVSARASEQYYRFLVSDDSERLEAAKKVLEEHLIERYEERLTLTRMNLNASRISDNTRQNFIKTKKKDLHAAFNLKKDQKAKQQPSDPLKKKFNHNDSIEELKEEEDKDDSSLESVTDQKETSGKKVKGIEINVEDYGSSKGLKNLHRPPKKKKMSNKKRVKESVEKE